MKVFLKDVEIKILHRFDQKRVCATSTKHPHTRMTRINTNSVAYFDSDPDALAVEATDQRRISRMFVKDMIKCSDGDRFIVLIPIELNSTSRFSCFPKAVFDAQKTKGVVMA